MNLICCQAYSCLPATVLASCVESVWSGRGTGAQTQLSRALWLWCGALGARVWLPLMPREATRRTDPSRHTFMAKRIMLPFHLNIYPLSKYSNKIYFFISFSFLLIAYSKIFVQEDIRCLLELYYYSY